jgi:hypothetical protein
MVALFCRLCQHTGPRLTFKNRLGLRCIELRVNTIFPLNSATGGSKKLPPTNALTTTAGTRPISFLSYWQSSLFLILVLLLICTRWKAKAVKGPSARNHGVYVEEPRLLNETLSASMSEPQKFGTYSQFDRSKYKTQDRRKLGPKFDEYSPHVPKKSDVEKLPLEYRSLPLVFHLSNTLYRRRCSRVG